MIFVQVTSVLSSKCGLKDLSICIFAKLQISDWDELGVGLVPMLSRRTLRTRTSRSLRSRKLNDFKQIKTPWSERVACGNCESFCAWLFHWTLPAHLVLTMVGERNKKLCSTFYEKPYYFVCGGRALLWCSFSIPGPPKIVLFFFKSELHMTKQKNNRIKINNHIAIKDLAPSSAFKSA